MKKSRTIILGLLLVVASFLVEACDDPAKGDARRVDKAGAVVDPGASGQGAQRKAKNSSYVPEYIRYYVPNQASGGNAASVTDTGNQNASTASQNSNRRRGAGHGGFGFSSWFFPRAGA